MAIFGIDLDSTLGCIFIGALLSLILYGCTCAQTLYFYHHYPKDKVIIKILVLVIWILDTVKSAAEAQQMWFYLVAHHAQLLAIANLDSRSLGIEQLSEDIAKLLVQSYLLWKSWLFMHHKRHASVFTVASVVLVALQAAQSVWQEYILFSAVSTLGIVQREQTASAVGVGVNLVVDVFTTTALCYTLQQQRTTYQRTNSIITAIVTYLMSHGIVLCIVQVLSAIAQLGIDVHHGTYISEIFRAIQGTIYSNSLLVLLNTRTHIVHKTSTAINEPERPVRA